MKSRAIGQLLMILLWSSVLSCGDDNDNPFLETLIDITPTPPIYAGQVISIQASVTHSDGDRIEYNWNAVDSRDVNVVNEVFKGEPIGNTVEFSADFPDTYLITVTAIGFDEAEISFSFPIVVLPGNVPVVRILSPEEGVVQGVVNIEAEARDDKGVTEIEFYIDGSFVAERHFSPFSYSWDTAAVADGDHVIEAKAYDEDGNDGVSESVVVSVQRSSPKVEIIEPVNGGVVQWVTTVRGTYKGISGNLHIWLFVKPHTIGLWYSQNPPSMQVDGTWYAVCYFGDRGGNQGEKFDLVVALVDEDRVKELRDGGLRFGELYDPILALITVTRR